MNKLLAFAFLLAAIPARAQLEVPAEGMAALKAGMKSFGERLAPAAVERAPIDKLFDRLSRAQEGVFTAAGQPDKDGAVEIWEIRLNEVEPAADAAEDGAPAVRDLVYRRYFTDMEGTSQKVMPQKNGDTVVDEWKYVIGLDGSILSATRSVMIGKMTKAGELNVDKARSRVLKMSPKDPSVLNRWKKMQERFLRMGPTVEA